MKLTRLAVFGGLGAAIFLSLVAATCGNTTTHLETDTGQQKGITVSGTGKATSKPDIANISLGVSTLADTVEASRNQAAASMDGIIKSMKANGIDDKDIQTQQLNINPEYDYNNGTNKQTLRGFRVTNTVVAKVRNIDDTSKIVDDAVTAGGDDTQIQAISFSIDNPDALKEQAREAAVKDAGARADTLAKAAGVSVGDAITISESGYNGPQPEYYSGRAAMPSAADTASTPIQPGELDVSIDVTVTWDIGG